MWNLAHRTGDDAENRNSGRDGVCDKDRWGKEREEVKGEMGERESRGYGKGRSWEGRKEVMGEEEAERIENRISVRRREKKGEKRG